MTTSPDTMDCLTQVALLLIGLLAVYGQKGSDGFTDEERPYEFGFNIEGYQHRHEKKDEKGIIMGEFGFITADGIYHVTVYATDENGDFKILKMKNIKVGFPPGSALKPTTSTVAPSIASPTTKPPIQPASGLQAFSSTAKPTSGLEAFSTSSTFSTTPKIKVTEGCSSCKVPVPITKKPFSSLTGQSTSIPPRGGIFGTTYPQTGTFGGQFSPSGGTLRPAGDVFSTPNPPPSIFAGTPPPSSAQPQVGGVSSTPHPPSGISRGLSLPAEPEGHIPGTNIGTPRPPPSSFPGPSSRAGPDRPLTGTPTPPPGAFVRPSSPEVPEGHTAGGINGTPHPPAGAFVRPLSPARPEEHSVGGITGTPRPPAGSFFGPSSPAGPDGHLTGGIFGTSPRPVSSTGGPPPIGGIIAEKPPDVSKVPLAVERTGLPHGITESDIMKLLYRFNYTVGFHGHHEEGYRNGDKVGGYFVNGRNGVSTQVKYIANEFGYQPNITFIPIGLDSPDTPKQETEKNYGLKGYAFEWFYKR